MSVDLFMMEKVKIRDNEEYMTLNVLLKITDVISTGGMAKAFLAENTVFVNDEPENRRGRKLYRGDVVRVLKRTFLLE